MDKIKEYQKMVLDIAIEKIIFFIFSSVALGGIGKILLDWLGGQWPIIDHYSYLFVILFSLGGGLISIYLFKHFDRNIPHYKPFDFDFSVDKKEIIFEFKEKSNGDKATYVKKYTLRPLKNNLKVFEDKYSWTGKVCNEPVSAKSGQEYILTKRKGTWQPYDVKFEPHLNKNQPIDIEGKWELENVSGAVPFISTTIEHPTKKLIFRLKVPKDLKIASLNCEIFAGMGILISCGKTESIPPDNEGNFEWIIDNPKLLHYYEASWSKPLK